MTDAEGNVENTRRIPQFVEGRERRGVGEVVWKFVWAAEKEKAKEEARKRGNVSI